MTLVIALAGTFILHLQFEYGFKMEELEVERNWLGNCNWWNQNAKVEYSCEKKKKL